MLTILPMLSEQIFKQFYRKAIYPHLKISTILTDIRKLAKGASQVSLSSLTHCTATGFGPLKWIQNQHAENLLTKSKFSQQ